MKTILLMVVFIIFFKPGYSQHTKATYAIVSVKSNYDKANKRYWVKINAESVGVYSKEITGLVNYSIEKGAINTGANFYFKRNDTASVYFNYFLSITEAFQFLADHQ